MISRHVRGAAAGCLGLAWAWLAAPPAAAKGHEVAAVEVGKEAIRWQPAVAYERLVLTVSGPRGEMVRSFAAGEAPYLEAEAGKAGRLPDGAYSWELRLVPQVDQRTRERLAAAREAMDRGVKVDLSGLRPAAGPAVQSGHFAVREGRFATADEPEPPPRLQQTGDVRIAGDLEAAGKKAFVAPDPRDGGRQLVYAALEGPEAGTYHRGSSRTAGGTAVIELPGHFASTTEAHGLTVQLTPIGGWARLYVAERSPRRLVVRSADGADVEFDYFVQGVRRGYADFQVERPAPPAGPDGDREER